MKMIFFPRNVTESFNWNTYFIFLENEWY